MPIELGDGKDRVTEQHVPKGMQLLVRHATADRPLFAAQFRRCPQAAQGTILGFGLELALELHKGIL
jgi:hypothetical protein